MGIKDGLSGLSAGNKEELNQTENNIIIMPQVNRVNFYFQKSNSQKQDEYIRVKT